MITRNYVLDDRGEYRVLRGWVEDGYNVTFMGPYGPIISIKNDELSWTDPDCVKASYQRPFDRKGFPTIDGPDDWLDC